VLWLVLAYTARCPKNIYFCSEVFIKFDSLVHSLLDLYVRGTVNNIHHCLSLGQQRAAIVLVRTLATNKTVEKLDASSTKYFLYLNYT
jgi:hypothetical protein